MTVAVYCERCERESNTDSWGRCLWCHQPFGTPKALVIVAAKPRWTRESAILAIQEYAVEHGRPPATVDALGNRSLPPYKTCAKFGGWATLIEAAGFPRPTRATRYEKKGGRKPVNALLPESP